MHLVKFITKVGSDFVEAMNKDWYDTRRVKRHATVAANESPRLRAAINP